MSVISRQGRACLWTQTTKNDILNKEDRDNIFRVCFAACGRELAKLNTAE
jgi:hypothetical protein